MKKINLLLITITVLVVGCQKQSSIDSIPLTKEQRIENLTNDKDFIEFVGILEVLKRNAWENVVNNYGDELKKPKIAIQNSTEIKTIEEFKLLLTNMNMDAEKMAPVFIRQAELIISLKNKHANGLAQLEFADIVKDGIMIVHKENIIEKYTHNLQDLKKKYHLN